MLRIWPLLWQRGAALSPGPRNRRSRRANLGKVLKVGGEGLARAAGVLDDDRHAGGGHQAEGHRHAVVVVRVDRHVGLHAVLGRGDHAIVAVLLHLRAELAQLGDDGHHALRLLDAPVVHVPDGGGPVRQQGGHRERHGGVRDVVAVVVDRRELAARRAGHRHRVGLPLHRRAHQPHHLRKALVALQRVAAAADDADGAARHGGARQEVAGAAGVALHEGLARSLVRLPARDLHVLQPVHLLHHHAEARHQLDRHVHVRLADELVHDDDLHPRGVGAQRRGHEQRGEVLAADAAADAHGASRQPLRLHLHGRAAGPQRAARLHAQLHQPVHQVLDGPLPHARDAVEHKGAAPRRRHRRGERAHRGAGVAEEEVAALHGEAAAAAVHRHAQVLPVLLQLHAQRLERAHHVADVVAVQEVLHEGGALR
mmetsp:Transcript_13333/g.34563  ORF Transcript_13333/g.34563 Transcript_13333/m.34563 type:complete len:426 (-) Transcript_13333:110-1387(-)